MKKLTILKRMTMLILFTCAFMTTIFSVTNVSAMDITQGFYASHDNHVSYTKLKTKKVALVGKTYKHQKAKTTYISSAHVEAPENIEEAINFEQYPSMTVTATGYTAGIESTGKTPNHPLYGITYSGVKVKRDLYSTIAADLSVYPIGTIMYIPGYGYGVVADKGSAIKGNKIDLYYPTVEQVYKEWGKKQVEVYVIKKGNGKLTEEALSNLNETKALQVFREKYRKRIDN